MTTFRYEKSLIGSRNTREIRLIALQPGESDCQLECTLRYVSLSSDPEYEAISYTWGGQEPSKPILCDGLVLNITPNLHDALRQFRSPEALVFLWADAICINQEDLDEKNEQVPLMGMIYGKASKVKIWLGHENETTRQVPKIVAELNSLANHYSLKLSVPLTDLASLDSTCWSDIKDDFEDEDATQWDALIELLHNPWFSRAWIVQEVALARGRAWLHCGETILWWPDVSEAILFMIQSGIAALATLPKGLSTYLTCYKLASLARTTSMVMDTSETKNEGLDILWLLYSNMPALATNPLDKIYAFLSMAKNNLLIVPNYHLSAAELYQEVSEKCLSEYPAFPIFTAAGLRPPDPSQTPDLPSWVVDWNYREPENMDNIIFHHKMCESGATGIYNAGLANTYTKSYSVNGNILTLGGFLLDQVTDCAIPVMGPDESFSESLSRSHLSMAQKGVLAIARWHEAGKMFGRPPGGIYSFTGEAFFDAFGTTLFLGEVPEEVGPDLNRGVKDALKLARLYYFIKNSPLGSTGFGLSVGLNIARLLYMFMLDFNAVTGVLQASFGLGNKTMFKTSSGLMGVAWSTQVRVGDHVALIKGGIVPVILRSCSNGMFNLVGNAYVHGAMKGEMFDIDKCHELCIV